MKPTKNQIKKILIKKIEVNTSIPPEIVYQYMREGYVNFLTELAILSHNIFKTKDFRLENDCIIFETDRPYYYEIQADGHLFDISKKVWADHFDRLKTEDDALKN